MPALLIAVLAAASAAPPPKPACPPPAPQLADGSVTAPRRLDQLPPASLYLAIDRRIDGCLAPVIVRADIGSRPK